ncbi:MAG: hypothetical protein HY822_00595, partial [Acidobacteria bacterium]|nr:hypothetical protein [Acidobacteriota bacterium]
GREALAVRRTTVGGKPGLVLCGSDARGLMYAVLDAAQRVSWTAPGSDPFARIRDTSEKPDIAERGVSMYTMQRAWFESRLYDEEHWKRYFDLLAASRINSFVVIFGYENGGFLAPPYPYFFSVDGFPDVQMVGLTRQQQSRNAAAFQRLIALAHERGIGVTAAIWDHIYRGGVQGGGIPGASGNAGKRVPGLVWGVTTENLSDYTKAALRRLLGVFPDLDAIEFRMHGESGLKRSEMEGFWHEVFGMIRQLRPNLRVQIRAKELPDSIIDDALNQGLNTRVETKYWMEQMGLPFHPTHINRQNQKDRRHGYADLLRYPQRYKVYWRLWNGGTTRLLLWADPDYVRRFAASAHLYDGDSLEVNEMLATWMLGEAHEAPACDPLNPGFRYYDYPFERYWHFYQVWGRVSYNPATPPEVWEREFERRLGAPAGRHVMDGLHRASQVLPRIVAAAYRYQNFPTTRGWAEMQRQGDLPAFADLEGSDIEQFMSPREAARSILNRTETAKRRPEETAAWFARTSAGILEHVRQAEKAGAAGKELASSLTDLRILAALAQFYACRLPAAVSYNLFKETGNAAALEEAIAGEQRAIAAWEQLVAAAGDVYSDNLAFGAHAVGFSRHWKEELGLLRRGLDKLVAERRPLPAVRLDAVSEARPGQDLRITVRAGDLSSVKSIRLRYRHLTQIEDYQTAEMILDPQTGRHAATIPGSFIVPQWDLIYFVEVLDKQGHGRMYPDLDHDTPYVLVPLIR